MWHFLRTGSANTYTLYANENHKRSPTNTTRHLLRAAPNTVTRNKVLQQRRAVKRLAEPTAATNQRIMRLHTSRRSNVVQAQ